MFFLDEENSVTEKEIQTLYQTHPYLIEKQFLNQKSIPQYRLPSGFADLIVFLKNEIVVIELKIEPLEINHLLQLNGYLEDIGQEFGDNKRIRGILIGKECISDLNNALKTIQFEIKILIIEKNICTKIKICENCRLANDIKNSECFNCSNNSFF